MKKYFTIICTLVLLSGCGNKVFVKKSSQTQDQFHNDMMYCKGEALGAWNDRNGASQIGLRSQKAVPMTYEDCMLQMGYQQAP